MPKARNTERHDLTDLHCTQIDGLTPSDWQDAQNRTLDVMREVSDTINSISNAQARRNSLLYYVDGKKHPDF